MTFLQQSTPIWDSRLWSNSTAGWPPGHLGGLATWPPGQAGHLGTWAGWPPGHLGRLLAHRTHFFLSARKLHSLGLICVVLHCNGKSFEIEIKNDRKSLLVKTVKTVWTVETVGTEDCGDCVRVIDQIRWWWEECHHQWSPLHCGIPAPADQPGRGLDTNHCLHCHHRSDQWSYYRMAKLKSTESPWCNYKQGSMVKIWTTHWVASLISLSKIIGRIKIYDFSIFQLKNIS